MTGQAKEEKAAMEKQEALETKRVRNISILKVEEKEVRAAEKENRDDEEKSVAFKAVAEDGANKEAAAAAAATAKNAVSLLESPPQNTFDDILDFVDDSPLVSSADTSFNDDF